MVVLGDGEEWEKHRFRSMSLQTLPNTKQERLKQLEFGRVTNRLDDIQVRPSLTPLQTAACGKLTLRRHPHG